MPSRDLKELTDLLRRASAGDRAAENQVIALVYPELRRIAVKKLRSDPLRNSLQPTTLINEAYLHLFHGKPVEWQDRAHFFAVAARQMRFILVDYARKKRKRGALQISFDDNVVDARLGLIIQTNENLIALEEALCELEKIDPRASLGVELRFYGGLSQKEVAEVQNIDLATVKRDWAFAKSWLFSRLK